MEDCTNCGAILKSGATHCHLCGVVTPYQKSQRFCMNCGTPAATDAKTCLMCGHQIDALPRRATTFGVSWPGFAIGLAIVIGLTYGFFQIQPAPVAGIAITPRPTASFIPPTNTATPTITPTPTRPPTLTPTPIPPTATPTPIVHIIRTGETLLFIADTYDVTVDDILAANDITATTLLQVGQALIIPYRAGEATQSGPQERERPIITYIVKEGDTLSGIAFEHEVSMATIEQANPGIDLDILSIGQEITIPLRPPTFTPTPTITPTPSFTPRPAFQTPNLLLPSDGALIEGDEATVLLNWTSSHLLDEETFYVIFLSDEGGNTVTYWTQAGSYRLPEEARPKTLTTYSWYVVVMKRLGVGENNRFYGNALSDPSASRSFSWR